MAAMQKPEVTLLVSVSMAPANAGMLRYATFLTALGCGIPLHAGDIFA